MTSRLTVKNEDAPIKTIRNAPSNTQNNAPNDSLLFGDYLQKWVEIAKPNLQLSTYASYKMTAFYGLRRSELCGMKWNSIDFDKNTLTLNSSVVQTSVNGKLLLIQKDILKNASSKRTMPLIPEIKEALLKLKEQQDKNKSYFKNGYNQQYLDYVWVDDIGKLVNPNTVTCHFKSFLEQHGLPKIRFHELRHSCASLLIACGVSLKEIQEWLGHSAISTTADIYSHLN